MNESGLIFNLQGFCTDDGDGIRTTVFFKGCPLHCLWCHNPESQSQAPEICFDGDACIRCGACTAACPRGCHTVSSVGARAFARESCNRCGLCADACPMGALSVIGKRQTAEEILTQVKKDADFYGKNGGITLSGGEPLAQPQLAIALAKGAKRARLNVCVETSGFCTPEVLRSITPFVDCFLFDYKCAPEDYPAFVGAPFSVIEKSLAYLSSNARRTVLRCPIVPECIREDHFDSIARLMHRYHLTEAELLPYHRLGLEKSKRLGRPAQRAFTEPNKNGLFREARLLQEMHGLHVTVR